MNKVIGATLLILSLGWMSGASAQVAVRINTPGLYGHVDIGGYPEPPPVLYRQPVYAERVVVRDAQPIYLHVPPGHERHWRQHCAEYDACGRPVYFVRHDWYRNVYARRDEHRDGRDRHDDHRDGDRRDDHRDGDRRDGRGRN